MKGSNNVKKALRSSAGFNIEIEEKCYFIWSGLTSRHPWEDNHPKRVPNHRQNFDKLNIQCFDFSNGFKCSDVFQF